MRTPLYGHTDEATAYVVDDYPYGFKARTSIRYWLESDPKRGFRFVSQTKNPKTGRWNAPKKSTYQIVAGAMYLDESGHVQWTGLSEYSSAETALAFVREFPGADRTYLRNFAGLKARFAEKYAKGEVVMTINGVHQPLFEVDAQKYLEESKRWLEVFQSCT